MEEKTKNVCKTGENTPNLCDYGNENKTGARIPRALRMKLIEHTHYELSDLPLIMDFLKGNDNAFKDYEEFYRWREDKRTKESLSLL